MLRSRTTPRYPRGLGPSARRFAIASQLALLQKALAPWPRRQAPLLEVNCGNGSFFPFLWQCGFDVHGVEAEFAVRQTAQRRPVPGLLVYAAQDTDLPFDNDSFDWVILHLKNPVQLRASAEEAIRLAKRGVMFTFWNSASLPALCFGLTHKQPWAPNAIGASAVVRILRKLEAGRLALLSTLACPVCLWKGGSTGVTPGISALPVGAWCIARLDLGNATPVTPLPLRLGASLRQNPEPAIEYAQKHQANSTETK